MHLDPNPTALKTSRERGKQGPFAPPRKEEEKRETEKGKKGGEEERKKEEKRLAGAPA